MPQAPGLQSIGRTAKTEPTAIQHMRVNHRRSNIGMTEQLLNGSNVRSTLEKMGGERMAEGVTRHTLPKPRRSRSLLDRALYLSLVQVVSASYPRTVNKCPRRGEQVEPRPFTIRIRKLLRQRAVDPGNANTAPPISPPGRVRRTQHSLDIRNRRICQRSSAILVALAATHRDFAPLDVDIFHPQ